MISDANLLSILVTSIFTSISIILVAVTFFLSRYEEVKEQTKRRWKHYERSIVLMNIALIFAILSLSTVILSILDLVSLFGYTIPVVLFAIEIGIIIFGVFYLSHKSLDGGLTPF
jgi:amino acid transporter